MIRFAPERAWTVRFDGARWSVQRGDEEAAEVLVETTPYVWVGFLMAAPSERSQYATRMHVTGAPGRMEEFLSSFGWKLHDRRAGGAVTTTRPAAAPEPALP